MSEDHMVSRELSQAASVKVLSELLARLEAAEGPDKELDADLTRALDPKAWTKFRNWAAMPSGAPEDVMERDARVYAETLTASLDASLALVERALPGWDLCLDQYGPRSWEAMLHGRDSDLACAKMATTPALALLCALIKVLIARDFAGSDTSEPS